MVQYSLTKLGDLTENLQLKLLRVLQEREFERLGGNNPIQIKARFLAATNQNIALKVKDGTFREDLYFRLNVGDDRVTHFEGSM